MSEKRPEVLGYATLLRELKGTDTETGLLTRSNLYNKLLHELARCDRYGNKLSIVIIRIVGGDDPPDAVVVEFAKELGNQLSANIRNVDEAARWSEREFLVVLPETDIEGAQVLIRKAKVFINELLRQSRNSNLEVQTQFTSWGNGDDMPGILSRVGL
jgi:GGDEF domain-containing protein